MIHRVPFTLLLLALGATTTWTSSLLCSAWVPMTTTTASQRRRFLSPQTTTTTSPHRHLGRFEISSNGDPTNTPGGDNVDDVDDDECPEEEECEIDWSKMPGMSDDVDETGNTSNSNDDDNTAAVVPSTTVDELRAILERQFQLDAGEQVKSNMQTLERYVREESSDDDASTTTTMTPAKEKKKSGIAGPSGTDFARRRLEMQWGLQQSSGEECDIYEPITCGGHVCTACNGNGICICRFCRGTKQLYLPIPSSSTTTSASNVWSQSNDDDGPKPTWMTTQSSESSPFVSCKICSPTGHEMCRPCRGSGWIADWTEIGVSVGDFIVRP